MTLTREEAMTERMTELLPCPFCGAPGEVIAQSKEGNVVNCSDAECPASMADFDTDQWNSRPLAPAADGVVVPESGCWLVRTFGGEGPSVFAFCNTLDDVRRTFAAMMFGRPEDANQDEIDALMESFQEPEHWSGDSRHWSHPFEIDGIEAYRLEPQYVLASAPPVTAAAKGK